MNFEDYFIFAPSFFYPPTNIFTHPQWILTIQMMGGRVSGFLHKTM